VTSKQHLQALEQLPADAIVPALIALSAKSAARGRQLITRLPEPKEDMKRLFDDR
jgi:hypothetical protein